MKRLTTLFAAGAAVLALGALAAGCGSSSGASAAGGSGKSSGGYGYGPSSSGSRSKAAVGGAEIAVRNSSLGPIVVNGQGRTVYLFEKDTGTASTCYGACASIWPPVTTSGAPKAGKGVDASELGTRKRSDGTLQVTYNGHPLYTYTGDSSAGQTNGEGVDGFGAEWYAVSPAGQVVENGGS
jgi:predicted lipoprotein with Yx(FWY)xxD motif